MWAGSPTKWPLLARLLAAFAVANLLALPLLPPYAQLTAAAAEWAWNLVRPHSTGLEITQTFPQVAWQWTGALEEVSDVSFRLIAYNGILYATLLAAIGLGGQQRLLGGATGFAFLFVFHIADLMLAIESRLLTQLRPESYSFWEDFDLWFVLVKFGHSYSVLVLKQVLPGAILWLQWAFLRRAFGED